MHADRLISTTEGAGILLHTFVHAIHSLDFKKYLDSEEVRVKRGLSKAFMR